MEGDLITGVLLPFILACIMFSLGLGLTLDDFSRIVRQPRALLIGILCHFVLLPIACFGLIKLFGLSGTFAIGFMILAACPTGTTSNLLTYVARGDVALAVSFTAVASVATIFTLPPIVVWSLQHFSGSATPAVAVPVKIMMGQVFLMLGLPVGLGLLVRHRWPVQTLRWEPRATRAAAVLFILIVIAAVGKNWGLLRDNFGSLAGFAVTLNLSMLALGFLMAWAARLSRAQSVTLGIETAVQNATLAIVIASSVLKDDALAIPGALYGVLMYAGGLAFAFGIRRLTSPSSAKVPCVDIISEYSQ
jgi:BASS family bile acid:Na+ symporter